MKIKDWRCWDWLFRVFVKRSLTILTAVFLIGITIMFILLLRYGETVKRDQVLHHVKDAAHFLQSSQMLYNDEVINRVNGLEGITITHAPMEAGTIPLPATFLKTLSLTLDSQLQFRVYSDYPFPWRAQEGRAQDDFETAALATLKQTPDQPFYRFEKQGNRTVLRYAEAQILQPSCVKCHNTYAGTPKTDWQAGDVRGILALTQPLAFTPDVATRELRSMFPLIIAVHLLGALGLSLAIRRLRRSSILLERRVAVRQQGMQQAFTQIHNGPLQTLALLIRDVERTDLSRRQLHERLQDLNTEIRAVGHSLIEEAGHEDISVFLDAQAATKLRLGDGTKIDLACPLHELFYEVFSLTLNRPLPCFAAIRAKVRTFEPLESKSITVDCKRELCLWLEEALCNVGKHAQGAKRVVATGLFVQNEYVLSVQDNGAGLSSAVMSEGSHQAQKLAQQLGGQFER